MPLSASKPFGHSSGIQATVTLKTINYDGEDLPTAQRLAPVDSDADSNVKVELDDSNGPSSSSKQ